MTRARCIALYASVASLAVLTFGWGAASGPPLPRFSIDPSLFDRRLEELYDERDGWLGVSSWWTDDQDPIETVHPIADTMWCTMTVRRTLRCWSWPDDDQSVRRLIEPPTFTRYHARGFENTSLALMDTNCAHGQDRWIECWSLRSMQDERTGEDAGCRGAPSRWMQADAMFVRGGAICGRLGALVRCMRCDLGRRIESPHALPTAHAEIVDVDGQSLCARSESQAQCDACVAGLQAMGYATVPTRMPSLYESSTTFESSPSDTPESPAAAAERAAGAALAALTLTSTEDAESMLPWRFTVPILDEAAMQQRLLEIDVQRARREVRWRAPSKHWPFSESFGRPAGTLSSDFAESCQQRWPEVRWSPNDRQRMVDEALWRHRPHP
jgi:hypothetical protein